MPPLILASSSPRRLELLARLGVVPDRVDAPEIDEGPLPAELPRAHVERVARAKAEAVAARHPGAVVLAGDTSIAVGRRILGKPADDADQARMLRLMAGRRHHCLSAVCVIDAAGTRRARLSDTVIAFRPLAEATIAAYIAGGEGRGKAGGYAIQGRAEAWVRHLAGSHSGVVGLPLGETRALLIAAGLCRSTEPMSGGAHWLYEAGIGEARAVLVEDGAIVAAAIEPEGTLAVGTVARARLVELLPRRQGRIAVDGAELLMASVPAGTTQGAAMTVVVTREAIPESGRLKSARAAAIDAATRPDPLPGPDLLARIIASGLPVRRPLAHEADAFEAAGWSELLEEATGSDIGFPGGTLRMSPTPAMTLFDVDGHLDPEPLAIAAAAAVGAAIRRHGIGGSIGVDFPTLAGKAARQAVAAALDDAMAARFEPTPFERTGVNGFGFLQLVRPRPRASLPELLRADPVRAATTGLLRRLERTPPGAPTAERAPAAVIRHLDARPAWLAELARRTGVVHRLDPR